MSMIIPYDPSLVLGNIVPPENIKNLLEIARANVPVDVAQENMNNLIAMKRSIDMTTKELINMKIDPSELNKESETLKAEISQAAADYVKIKIAQEKQIKSLKANSSLVNSSLESPIDYNRTKFTSFPLSSDSLKMDCQYFSFNENKQSADNQISTITNYISGSVSSFGNTASASVGGTAVDQISQQRETHNISGTLVVSVTCTHQNARILAPFILDVDKSIRIWNTLYKDDRLRIQDPTSIIKAALEEGTDKEKFLPIISGATYGSCFIGMVHILNKSSTITSQKMKSIVANIQAKAKGGMWFSKYTGKLGLDSSFSNDIKNMLSSQEVTSHVNLITMGLIPSIKSQDIKMAVKTFAKFDADQMMANLASLREETNSNNQTFSSAVSDAENDTKVVAIEGAKVKNIMLGLQEIESDKNKILDINSMMEALDDYIVKANSEGVGIPINFYIKPISKVQLAQMWVGKYYPDEYMSISGDDSGSAAE